MLRNLVCLAVAAIIVAGCVNVQAEKCSLQQQTECRKPAQVLRHVVLFKFKEGTPAEKVAEIENAFAALPSKIDAIRDFEWGTNVSVEDLSHGYTHCFVVTFLSEEARAEYLPHPAHKEFGSLLRGHLEEVTVVDYWTSP